MQHIYYRLMIALTLSATIFSTALINHLSAQQTDSTINHKALYDRHNYDMLKTNPLTVLWGAIPFTSEYRITYETSTAMNQYAQIGVAYLGKNVLLFNDALRLNKNTDLYIVNGYKVHLSYRWRLTTYENSPRGLYIGPHISYAHTTFEHKTTMQYNDYAYIEHFHIAMILGVQIEYLDIFYGDIFIGGGYKNNSWRNHVKHPGNKLIGLSEFDFIYNIPFKAKLGFSLGVKLN